MKGAISLLAAAAAGAVLGAALLRAQRRFRLHGTNDVTDPAIPPSESSATRLGDQPQQAQDDADQEPL